MCIAEINAELHQRRQRYRDQWRVVERPQRVASGVFDVRVDLRSLTFLPQSIRAMNSIKFGLSKYEFNRPQSMVQFLRS